MHNGKVLDISPVVKIQKTDDTVRVIGSTDAAVQSHENTSVRNVETDTVALRTTQTGVRTNTVAQHAVNTVTQAGVSVMDADRIIVRTNYRGPQGPKGDTSTFNDLEIPSLAARFLNRLS